MPEKNDQQEGQTTTQASMVPAGSKLVGQTVVGLRRGRSVHGHGYTAPSRVGQVSVAAYVGKEVRQALQMLALEKGVTVQHLLCVAINDLLEGNGKQRLADETMPPRGGAAHKRG